MNKSITPITEETNRDVLKRLTANPKPTAKKINNIEDVPELGI
jgi:hypothetical protein